MAYKIEPTEINYVVVYDYGGFSPESFNTRAEAETRAKERAKARPKEYGTGWYNGDGSTIYHQTISWVPLDKIEGETK